MPLLAVGSSSFEYDDSLRRDVDSVHRVPVARPEEEYCVTNPSEEDSHSRWR